jgi:hypothetical protein
VQYLTQPTAVALKSRPRLDYKIDMFFVIHTSTKEWKQISMSTSPISGYSGHYIGNSIVPEMDLLVKKGIQPTAAAHHPRPHPASKLLFKIDRFFLIHTGPQ